MDDLLAPVEQTLADTQIGSSVGGITTVPHLREFAVVGPYARDGRVGHAEPPPHFHLPAAVAGGGSCRAPTKIVTRRSATQGYRRPVSRGDVEGLMKFYVTSAQRGGFEAGVRTALQAILASPHFMFRLEEAPATSRPGSRTGSTTSISRRGSRSSSGAAGRTTS